jgi:hypothetical protein
MALERLNWILRCRDKGTFLWFASREMPHP